MTPRGNIGILKETTKSDDVVSYEWRIPYFLNLTGERSSNYDSPNINFCDRFLFYFKIYPSGVTQLAPLERCDLFLLRSDRCASKTFNITVAIKGSKGVKNIKNVTQELSFDYGACFWRGFCWESELIDRESGLMNGNDLIIVLDIKNHVPRNMFTQTLKEDRENEVSTEKRQNSKVRSKANGKARSAEKQGIEKVVEDIGKLLVSGERSDVILQVGDVEFKVHSVVLFARCPALSVSLRHESQEKANKRIVIKDCKREVFADFLQFLYTGSVQSLTEQNVFDLHCLADRYLADDLKQQCLEHIQGTMSIQTFCASLRLALKHEHMDLLEQAVEFFAKNMRSIIRTVEWQVFNSDHPTEANEMLIKALGPES